MGRAVVTPLTLGVITQDEKVMVDKVRFPLLNDVHNHPLLYAAMEEGIDLSEDPHESRDHAVKRIRAYAEQHKSGWCVVHGWNRRRYWLTQREFDDLLPVVSLDTSTYGMIVNQAGRALLYRYDPEV